MERATAFTSGLHELRLAAHELVLKERRRFDLFLHGSSKEFEVDTLAIRNNSN
jgi:hypothetical protein